MGAVGLGLSPVLGRSGVGFSGAPSWWEAGGAAGALLAYQPKGAASLAASYVNLANPGTYDAAPGSAPAWAALTGWTFNGSSHYLDTGLTPPANCTIGIRFANLTADDWLIGSHDWNTGDNLGIEVASWGGRFHNLNVIFDGVYSAGVKLLAWNVGYMDGVAVNTIATPGAVPGFSLFIGGRNARGSVDMRVGADVLAVVVYDNKLDATKAAAVSAAMAAL